LLPQGARGRCASLTLRESRPQSFDHDEALTAGRDLQSSLWDTLSARPASERTPPLYYAVAWGWSRLSSGA